MQITSRILICVFSTIFIFCHHAYAQGGPGRPPRPITGRFPPVVRPGIPPRPFLTGNVVHGTCYFNDTYSPIRGRVDIRQDLTNTPPVMEVRVQVMGLPQSAMSDAEHAMHIHQWGDLSRGCYNAGPHFDTDSVSRHGGPNAMSRADRHDGDFGNLRQSNEGIIDSSFNVQNMMLVGDSGILGRSAVLHEGRDDLGRGNNPVSLQTGNSGAPIACCVIGLADATNWDNPIFSKNQGTNPGMNPNINIMG